MPRNIYFFASFGNLKGQPTGGGTTAARRLRAMLEKFGYNVVITNRHKFKNEAGLKSKVRKYFWLCADPVIFFFQLLFRKRKDSTVLFMTYAGSLLPFDYLISLAATLTGHRLLMYLAGGKAYKSYYEGGSFYKWLFRATVRQYDEIMTEGAINVKLIKDAGNGKVRAYHLPNFTEDGFAPAELPKKDGDKVNIMFFGRIAPEKNITLILDIFEELQRKYPFANLLLVGSGPKDYEAKVKSRIESSPSRESIEWKAWADHATLKGLMSGQHIYLFPSAEPCEGHSNALNEAMSWGLVPVVSSNNFLPAIVGIPELVADGYNKELYISIISKLIDEDRIEEYSNLVYNRVKDNFTQSVVERKLEKELSAYWNL